MIKFIYSETASQFYKIFPLLLTVCTVVKSKWKISQNFAAFSEYMNFNAINSNSKTLTPFVVIEIDSCFFVCVFSGSQVFDPRFQWWNSPRANAWNGIAHNSSDECAEFISQYIKKSTICHKQWWTRRYRQWWDWQQFFSSGKEKYSRVWNECSPLNKRSHWKFWQKE